MKLLELDIENFGTFSDQRLQLGDGGFQLVYGPNEAGKSTLLQLIRELLFGFRHQNPYAWDRHAGEMAATALVELADGRRIRFRRRKGRTDEVVGQTEPDGEAVDAAALSRLLGSANVKLYQNVFGFSLSELASGEKSLQHAPLSEALYGGGIGGLANFHKVQLALKAEHESLFSPRATSRTVNRLLKEIRQSHQQLRAAMVKPRDYDHMVDQCQQHDAATGDLHAELGSLRRRRAHVQRLSAALTPFVARVESENQLGGLVVPDSLPPDAAVRLQQITQRSQESAAELADLEREVASVSARLSQIQLAPKLLEAAAEVKHLEQQVGQMRSCRAELPSQRRAAAEAREKSAALLRQLDPQWDVAQLERFQSGLEQRELVRRTLDESQQLRKAVDELAVQRGGVARDVAGAEQRLQELAAIQDVPQLVQVVERYGRYQANRDKLHALRVEIDSVDAEIATLRTRLSAPLERAVDVAESLSVPLAETVREYRQRLAGCQQAISSARQRVQDASGDLEDRRRALAQLEAEEPVPGRDELAATRARRDAGWQLIRQKYVKRKAVDDQIAGWLLSSDMTLSDAYERQVRQADELADRRQARAELVARREQLEVEIEQGERTVAQAEARLAARQQEAADCERAWQQVWSACPFCPLSPDAMLDWLTMHGKLLDTLEQQNVRQIRRRELEAETGDFEDELCDALPEIGGSTEERLAEARRLIRRAQQATAERQTYTAQSTAKQQELADLDAQIADNQQRLTEGQQHWTQLLARFEFPEHWDVELADKILSGVGEARSEYEKSQVLDTAISDMLNQTEQFDASTAELCQRVAPHLSPLPAEEAVVKLSQDLDQAQQAWRDKQALKRDLERLQGRVTDRRRRQEELAQQQQQLITAAGVETFEELTEVARRAARRNEIQQSIDKATEQISAIRGAEPEATFLDELQAADEAAIAGELEELSVRIEQTEDAYRRAVEAAGVLRQRLEEVDGESAAAALQVQLESKRSELAAAVDRWAPLVLAQTLMKQAVERFEREHQPQMIREVKRLFARMTDGQYISVRPQLDQQGTLLVESQDGFMKQPHQLSTGTREQLYLAIRLAYVHHYCRDAEPLPLVMDDVLVNFDDVRAEGTLQVLLEIAESLQIIFLTCHHSMVELVARSLPTIEPIRLKAGGRDADLPNPVAFPG